MFGDDLSDVGSAGGSSVLSGESSLPVATPSVVTEASILDQIRDILLEAQKNGYWRVGVGGVDKVRHFDEVFCASGLDRGFAEVSIFLCFTLSCSHRLIVMWRQCSMDYQ
jgi:hypothetical protein